MQAGTQASGGIDDIEDLYKRYGETVLHRCRQLWLYSIATRTCLDELRRRKRQAPMPPVELDDRGRFEQLMTKQRIVADLLGRFSPGVQEIAVGP